MADKYEYFDTGDTGAKQQYGVNWAYQTFTVGEVGSDENHKIASVKLLLYRIGNPGEITVSVRAVDANEKPTGVDLCSGTIDGDLLTDNAAGEWKEITLSGYSLQEATQYAIVVRSLDGDAGNKSSWRGRFDAGFVGLYSGGAYGQSIDSGVTWEIQLTWDMMFEVWGDEIVVPTVTTQAVSTIKHNVAIGHGNITNIGLDACSKRGVCWNTTGTPTIANSKSENNGSFDTGPFSNLITGLLPSTKYYVRAYARNLAGYGYGADVEFDTLEAPAVVEKTLVGTTQIDALDLLAQLSEEVVVDYEADKSVSDIIDDLLLLQVNVNPITKGTIDYSESLKIEIPQDTVLGGIMRLREILGGYVYVDNDRALQWRESIGEDKGQQIRFRKNLIGITRTVDYYNFANRIHVSGGGDPPTTLDDNVAVIQVSDHSDIGRKWFQTVGGWQFGLGGFGYYWGAGSNSATEYMLGGGGRFRDLPIPAGSTIISAKVKFCSSKSSSSIVKSRFKGELDVNPATFSDQADYDARVRTVASVDWDSIESWKGVQVVTENWYESPELKTILQEVVDLGGWVSGKDFVVFWDDHDNRSDVGAHREAWTYAPYDRTPILTVEYRPTIADNYIEDLPSQIKYGGVYTRKLVNKAILDADTLYIWAIMKLIEMKDPYISYTVDVANLEPLKLDFEALQLGSIIRVIDEDLGINVQTRIARIIRDLINPLNIQLEIANKSRDIIEQLGRDYRWRQANY